MHENTETTPAPSTTARPFGVDARGMVESDPVFIKVKAKIEGYASYPFDWDDEEGVPASPEVAKLAVAMLRTYIVTTKERNKLGNADDVWVRPSVNLLNDGSITLYWDVPGYQAYITVGPGEDDIRSVFRLEGQDAYRFPVLRRDAHNLMDIVARVIVATKQFI